CHHPCYSESPLGLGWLGRGESPLPGRREPTGLTVIPGSLARPSTSGRGEVDLARVEPGAGRVARGGAGRWVRGALRIVGWPARTLLVGAIRLYRATLAGALGGQCRFD